VPFPEDLSDILPLLPGDKVVRRVTLGGSVILVEIEGSAGDTYNLQVDVYYEGEKFRIFGVDRLHGEEAAEILWRQFLDERRALLADHDKQRKVTT